MSLARPTVTALRAVAAQTAADAQRLKTLGAQNLHILGNIKFDVTPSPEKLQLGQQWRQQLGARPVWLAASTRDGEETLILDAFARQPHRDLLLLLVPRHPQRFAEVAEQVAQRGLSLARRSSNVLPDAGIQVWLGDSMGEMPAYFALADVALIGGTLLPFGGQNLIEAAACGCPVLVGPHTYNFAQATEDALNCGAARRVANAAEAVTQVAELLTNDDARNAMRVAATRFSQGHRGATERTLRLIRELLA